MRLYIVLVYDTLHLHLIHFTFHVALQFIPRYVTFTLLYILYVHDWRFIYLLAPPFCLCLPVRTSSLSYSRVRSTIRARVSAPRFSTLRARVSAPRLSALGARASAPRLTPRSSLLFSRAVLRPCHPVASSSPTPPSVRDRRTDRDAKTAWRMSPSKQLGC